MKRLISHRGNLSGVDVKTENNPKQIIKVLDLELECEVDVWLKGDQYYLGHDSPQYPIFEEFLENSSLWCHAKNIQSLLKIKENKYIHYFWHEKDTMALTSKGFIWAFPREIAIPNSIVVLPEKYNTNVENAVGICSDFIDKFR